MRRTVFLSAAGLAFLSACAMPPEGTTPEDIARYEAAVASVGCELVTEPHYLAVEIQTGMSRETVLAVTQYELDAKRAERLPSGGVKLLSEACL